jgi:hypothetical protein
MHKVNPIKEEWGGLQRDNDLEKANEAIDDNRVVQDILKVASDTYTLAQGYNCTCEFMIMKWCTWYGAMQNAMMQCRQILVHWARMHDTSNNIGMTGSNGKSPNLWVRSYHSSKGKEICHKEQILLKILIGNLIDKRIWWYVLRSWIST